MDYVGLGLHWNDLSVGQKFTVLNVEGFDELVVMVYVGQIVQLLKHKMTRVV